MLFLMEVSPNFTAIYPHIGSKKYRYIAKQGATRSGKTYAIMQALILYTVTSGKSTQVTVSSVSLPHLKQGALKDFHTILIDLGLDKRFKYNRSDHVYTFKDTGAYIEFKSFDTEGKARGGSRDILFVNEANVMPQPIFHQLNLRTRIQTIIDFNPSEAASYVYDIADGFRGSCLFTQSTYLHNPFLPIEQIKEIERLKEIDPFLWEVFGLGKRGKITNLIFQEGNNWEVTDKFPERVGQPIIGLDFGYTHPMAMVEVVYYENCYWVREKLYKSNIPASMIVHEVEKQGIGRFDLLICDSARPDMIADLRNSGINAFEAEKDVHKGIYEMKASKIKVHKDSLNLIKELRNYKWQVDKNGEVKQPMQPVKFMDDAIDAMRYAIYTARSIKNQKPLDVC